MYGSVKPYRRQVYIYILLKTRLTFGCFVDDNMVQVVISTGKSDWEFDVTSESGSLASYLSSATGSGPKLPKKPKPEGEGTNGTKESSSTKDGDGSTTTAENQEKEKAKEKKRDVGLFTSSSQKRISILNGSHHTVCDDPTLETVLLFPDFKIITEVEKSRRGAEQLWQTAVSPAVGRAGVVLPKIGMICFWDTILQICCVNFFLQVFIEAGKTGGFQSYLSNDWFLLSSFCKRIGRCVHSWSSLDWSSLLSCPSPDILVVFPFSYQCPKPFFGQVLLFLLFYVFFFPVGVIKNSEQPSSELSARQLYPFLSGYFPGRSYGPGDKSRFLLLLDLVTSQFSHPLFSGWFFLYLGEPMWLLAILGALIKMYLTMSPPDRGVVVFQPIHSQKNVILSQISDEHLDTFGVCSSLLVFDCEVCIQA